MNGGSIAAEAWQWLGRELDRWSAEGRQVRFWWRDDDAAAPDDRLDRLLGISEERRIPLALAAIPARIEDGLAVQLRDRRGISILQHGYAHRNHASPGERKLELGGTRADADILDDLQRGFELLRACFGASFVPVLVPPWNRLRSGLIGDLPGIGFRGVSIMKARREARPAPALLQVNCHLDPINWRHDGGFLGVCPAIAILIQHLTARRGGYRDAGEPTGILSHHLVQNEAVWTFLDDLFRFLSAHPAVEFIGADQIWK
ncbi:MAG: polysaccharide deacetylase family protein [Gammaproteobacteria bacterium]